MTMPARRNSSVIATPSYDALRPCASTSNFVCSSIARNSASESVTFVSTSPSIVIAGAAGETGAGASSGRIASVNSVMRSRRISRHFSPGGHPVLFQDENVHRPRASLQVHLDVLAVAHDREIDLCLADPQPA